MKPKKVTIKERKRLKKRAWTVFAKFIRERDNNTCVTCGRTLADGYVMNAGHFIHNREDFNEKNIHCQCFVCNKIKHGNMKTYCIKMVEWYGIETVKELLKKERQESVLETGQYYLDIIQRYS
jgi:hypothetical protein